MNGQLGYWSLNVGDTGRAQRFFGELFGWSYGQPGAKGGVHIEGTAGGFHPAVLGVSAAAVLVDDLDTSVDRVWDLGGRINGEVTPPPMGYVEAADPAGARFALVAFAAEYLPPSPAPTGNGHLAHWGVQSPDQEVSRGFFTALFGWQYGDPGSAGGLPIEGTDPLGFLTPDGVDALTFHVDDAAAIVQAIRRLGGTAPDAADSPHGPWAPATDDQGTRFSIWQGAATA